MVDLGNLILNFFNTLSDHISTHPEINNSKGSFKCYWDLCLKLIKDVKQMESDGNTSIKTCLRVKSLYIIKCFFFKGFRPYH